MGNMVKRHKLYRKFWTLLGNLGVWNHPLYMAYKITKTSVHDRRDVMPDCVLRVSFKLYSPCSSILQSFSQSCVDGSRTELEYDIQTLNLPVHLLLINLYPDWYGLAQISSEQASKHWKLCEGNPLSNSASTLLYKYLFWDTKFADSNVKQGRYISKWRRSTCTCKLQVINITNVRKSVIFWFCV